MTKPLILITNDDGIDASGLQALGEALGELGEVIAVAPERERSAASHALSLHKPLRIKERRPGWFSCSGTPADCVYIGLHHVLSRPPDLVASGINSQVNLGDDVVYSGTAAGAREAALMDVERAVAFSVDQKHSDDAVVAQQALGFCRRLLAQPGTPRAFINVNFPRGTSPETPWRLTSLGLRNYGRQVTKKTDPRGRPYYWIGGGFLGFGDLPGSDCNAVQEGHISATPVHLRLTNTEVMSSMANWPLFNDQNTGLKTP